MLRDHHFEIPKKTLECDEVTISKLTARRSRSMYDTRDQSKDDRAVVQRQIYAGAAGVVGIVTFTTVEEEMANVSGAFRAIGSGLRFSAALPQEPRS